MTDDAPTADAAELASMIIRGRFQFLQLAKALLEADVAIAGWSPQTLEQAAMYRTAGWRFAVEISADKAGATIVSLVATSRGGAREVLGYVVEHALGAAN